jgi:predicted RNA polymerase sigma factor
VAVQLRPDKADYRGQLALAVAAFGGPEKALHELEALMVGHQDNGALWLERSMLLRAAGRKTEAEEAKRRAIHLLPGLSAFADSLPLPIGTR